LKKIVFINQRDPIKKALLFPDTSAFRALKNVQPGKIGSIAAFNITIGKFDNPYERGSTDMSWDTTVKFAGIYEMAVLVGRIFLFFADKFVLEYRLNFRISSQEITYSYGEIRSC
jgi:hypothetical protein